MTSLHTLAPVVRGNAYGLLHPVYRHNRPQTYRR